MAVLRSVARCVAVGAALSVVFLLQGCADESSGEDESKTEEIHLHVDDSVPVKQVKEAMTACAECKSFNVDEMIEKAGLKNGQVHGGRFAALLTLKEFQDKPTVRLPQILDKFSIKFELGAALTTDLVTAFLKWLPLDLKVLEEQWSINEQPKTDSVILKSTLLDLKGVIFANDTEQVTKLLDEAKADKDGKELVDTDKLSQVAAEAFSMPVDKAESALKEVAGGEDQAKDAVKKLLIKDSTTKVDMGRLEGFAMSKARTETVQVMEYRLLASNTKLGAIEKKPEFTNFWLWVPIGTTALTEALEKPVWGEKTKVNAEDADVVKDPETDTNKEALLQLSATRGKTEAHEHAQSAIQIAADGHLEKQASAHHAKDRMKRKTVARMVAPDEHKHGKSM